MQWNSSRTLNGILEHPKGYFEPYGKAMQIEELSHESNDAKEDAFIHVRKTDDDFVKLRKRSEVGSLKNKFELLIQDNNARKSSFINW